MNGARGVFGMLAFAVALALAGCRIHQPSEIDVRTDSPEAPAQDYEPAIVIISGGHRQVSKWLKVEEHRSHRLCSLRIPVSNRL